MHLALSRVRLSGLANFDARYTLLHVVLPVLLELVDLLLVPYFLARCAGWCYCVLYPDCHDNSVSSALGIGGACAFDVCAHLVRNCHLPYLLLRILNLLFWNIISFLTKRMRSTSDGQANAQLVNRE